MKPYYAHDGITIYHGDCLEVMQHLAPASFDLIFVDWPYFRVKDEPWDRQWDSADKFLAWLGLTLEQSKRLLKPNGSFYGCASPQMAARVELKVGEYFNVLNHIVWAKPGQPYAERYGVENFRDYVPMSERIIFAEQYGAVQLVDNEVGYYSQTKALHKNVYAPVGRYIQQERERAGVTRNQVEVALGYISGTDPSRGTALCYRWEEGSSLPTKETYQRLREYLNSIGSGDYLRREYEDLRREYEDLRREYEDLRRPFNATPNVPYTDIWTFPTVQDYPGKHPTEKPLAMLEHIIKMSTRPGGRVLDFTMGTGTTLRAAQLLGREAVGVDITEKYCKRAVERLLQPALLSLNGTGKTDVVRVMPHQAALFAGAEG